MSKKLELTLLGSIEIRRDGRPVTEPKAEKSVALLSYLAVTGRPHSRPALAGLLWGEMPEDKARGNLSKALSTLRRLFGDNLTVTRQTVALNRDSNYWLDVETFEAGVTGTSIEAWAVAVKPTTRTRVASNTIKRLLLILFSIL